MNTIKFNKKSSLVIAHRGLSGIEKENTASAFVAAGNRSYFGIETDIHRTADGKFIVCHDANLTRVAGENISVEEVSLAVSQSVILTDTDGKVSRVDLRTPTLADYIKICKRYEKHCVLELKSDFTDAEIAEIIKIIDSFNYLESVTFISFVYDNLLRVRKLLPSQSAQFLFSEITDEIITRVKADKLDVDVYYKALTEENIRALHEAGIKINCWTVNEKADGERLAAWGVDHISTNILE